jgi:hypothetical protein
MGEILTLSRRLFRLIRGKNVITWREAYENPELMIKYKDYLIDEKIFMGTWSQVFHRYPYLYREFSDRFYEMRGVDIAHALRDDPTLVSDLKNHLHKIHKTSINWALSHRPELSLCMKYRDNPDMAEAAYYIGYPHELDDLNKEEKREMSKRIIELLKEEKI